MLSSASSAAPYISAPSAVEAQFRCAECRELHPDVTNGPMRRCLRSALRRIFECGLRRRRFAHFPDTQPHPMGASLQTANGDTWREHTALPLVPSRRELVFIFAFWASWALLSVGNRVFDPNGGPP